MQGSKGKRGYECRGKYATIASLSALPEDMLQTAHRCIQQSAYSCNTGTHTQSGIFSMYLQHVWLNMSPIKWGLLFHKPENVGTAVFLPCGGLPLSATCQMFCGLGAVHDTRDAKQYSIIQKLCDLIKFRME